VVPEGSLVPNTPPTLFPQDAPGLEVRLSEAVAPAAALTALSARAMEYGAVPAGPPSGPTGGGAWVTASVPSCLQLWGVVQRAVDGRDEASHRPASWVLVPLPPADGPRGGRSAP